jgi:hypothetical protein
MKECGNGQINDGKSILYVITDLQSVGKLIPLVRLGYGQLFTHIVDPDLAQIITYQLQLLCIPFNKKLLPFWAKLRARKWP